MKILCCGQIKTGTNSIAKLMKELLFKVNHYPICLEIDEDYIILDNNYKYYTNSIINDVDNIISSFDVLYDYPYSYNYEYIYSLYPDAYFILTIRDANDWFNSLLTYQSIPGASNSKILKKLYNYEVLSLENKEEVINKYNMYNDEMQTFFKNKSNLLIINICNKKNDETNDILYKIKKFLNIDLNLEIELPHLNKQ